MYTILNRAYSTVAESEMPLKYWADTVSVRVTGHKTPGESSVILQIVVRVQLTSRRILRD